MQTRVGCSDFADDASAGLDRLPRRIFRFRMLGMGLAMLCIAAVLYENGASLPVWGLCAFSGLLWPHLALHVAQRSRSPYRAELRNLLIDSTIAGAWVGLMQFNLLPSVLLLTLVTVDKISTGVPRLWLWSLPVAGVGVLCGSAATGFGFRPDTSTAVLIAALPMLVIHTIAVSLASNRLVRQVREKNRLLDRLSRTDSLTGLHVRRHWLELAGRTLQQHHAGGEPATLLMLDVDHFKRSNDHHGHSAGDEVLRAVADVIRARLGSHAHAGRYGGDEFGVVLPGADTRLAQSVADDILRGVRSVALNGVPDARITVSIGMAQADRRHGSAKDWIKAADAALYRAKHAGRDRIAA